MDKKFIFLCILLLLSLCPLNSDNSPVAAAQSPVDVDSYSGTISVYSYSSFNMYSQAYTKFRKRYDTVYTRDYMPPDGIYNVAKRDCLDAAVNNCTDTYCIVIYENFKGFVFIGTYEYFNTGYRNELKMTDFIVYFKS